MKVKSVGEYDEKYENMWKKIEVLEELSRVQFAMLERNLHELRNAVTALMLEVKKR